MAASKPRRTSKSKKKTEPERPALRREIYGVLVASISLMLLFSLLSHNPKNADANWVGPVGRIVAESAFGFFGLGAFLLVVTAIAVSIWLLFGKHRPLRTEGIIGSLLVAFSSSALCSVIFPLASAWGAPLGGWIGKSLAELVSGVLGKPGAIVVLLASTVVGVILITRSSFVDATTRAMQRVRETSENLGVADRVGGGLGSLRDNTSAFFADWADRRRRKKEQRALDAELEAFDEGDDAFDDEPPAFPSTLSNDAAFDHPPARTHQPAPFPTSTTGPQSSAAVAAAIARPAPTSLAVGAPPMDAEAASAGAGPKAQEHAFDPPAERHPFDDEELHPGSVRAREILARAAAARSSIQPPAADAVEHATRDEDVRALAANAERVRAQMHHPIDNPMVNTTRANTPVDAMPPAAFEPPASMPAPEASSFAAAPSMPAAPAPAPAAIPRPSAFDPEAVAPAPAAPSAAATVAPTPMPPIVSQRLDIDIGVDDLPPPYEPTTEELDAPPVILRPVRHDLAAADPAPEDAFQAIDFDDDEIDSALDDIGATAPHRIAWSDLQSLQKPVVDNRTTRPIDALEDVDFDLDDDEDELTGPQIIESDAAKTRLTSEAMARALRAMEAERASSEWNFPSLDILRYEEATAEIDEAGLRELASQLVEALADYKVRGRVTGICPGPVVTRFEFEPDAGTKISRISGLSTDIAMRLRAENVRIIAPIPGKGCVGVEIPNDIRETVYLKEILADRRFTEARSKLTMALGKDIEGFPVVADLAKMPHLLVAGTTGSGKSVSVNAMITSVLFNATPDEVRLILIDPKQLEFALYEDVPHLLLPVVTDPMKAATALQWAVEDMERRYRLMKELRVRNIEGYNQKIKQLQDELRDEEAGRGRASAFAVRALSEEDLDGRPRHRHMPYIIVVVDEFADLMMAAGKDVEIAVARIAQKARAAGIHCILATQRPSVDVLTGTIKSNFPTRISFRLISGTDSRTVVDTNGAENLLGMGDMLFRPPGSSDLVRVHGAFVDEEEIERVVEFLKDQREVEYDETILSAQVSSAEDDAESGFDAKYDEALEVCIEAGFASISMIQRRCGIGYNRAANIIEEMERRGVVGPSSGGAKRREVYIRG